MYSCLPGKKGSLKTEKKESEYNLKQESKIATKTMVPKISVLFGKCFSKSGNDYNYLLNRLIITCIFIFRVADIKTL